MVAIYCRESTDKQDIQTLISMCEKEAIKLGFSSWEVYQDIESGYSNTRKDYLRLLNNVKNNKISTLILYESSRLTRDELEHQIFYRLLKENKVKLYILNRGWVNLDDEDDMFLSGLLNLLDAREGRKTAKRVKDRMKEIAYNGRWTGGPAPLGYNLVNKELIINEDEAVIIKEIFTLFNKGQSRNSIAKLFSLDLKRVSRILKNPVYIGKLKFREVPKVNKKVVYNKNFKIINGIHETIIDELMFKVTQEKVKRIVRETDKESYIFKNLIYCPCGKKSYLFVRKGKYYLRYYQCSSPCGSKLIKEDELIKQVLIELDSIIKNINVDNIETQKEETPEELMICTKQLSKLDKKEELLTRKMLDNRVSEQIFDKLISELNEKKNFYSQKIKILESRKINNTIKQSNKSILLKYFKNIKNETDAKKLNIFLATIIDRIEFINDYRFYIHLKF